MNLNPTPALKVLLGLLSIALTCGVVRAAMPNQPGITDPGFERLKNAHSSRWKPFEQGFHLGLTSSVGKHTRAGGSMEDGTTVCYHQYSQNPVVDAAACYRHCCRNNTIGSNMLNIRRGKSAGGHRMDLNPKTGSYGLAWDVITLVTLPAVITSRSAS